MTKFTWIKEEVPSNLIVKQVYGIVFSNDKRIILQVNDNKYNLTGGKPLIGETYEETAAREVLEEAGIHINIIPGFMTTSEYMIQNRVEKTVHIFVASTTDTNTVIQESEIEDYAWLAFDSSVKRLKFENDRKILSDARAFLIEHNHIQ